MSADSAKARRRVHALRPVYAPWQDDGQQALMDVTAQFPDGRSHP
jgi:hypothetical protein